MSESQLTDDEWEEICDAIMSYQWSPAPAPVRAERYIRRAVERILADRLEPYLDDRPHDPANNPTCAQVDEAADYQINGLQEALASVEALHYPVVTDRGTWCHHDSQPVPCATLRAVLEFDAHTEQKGTGR